ncbi:hypothetical protein OW293_016820 [Providencia rettgeri]|uniref:hypothetical protein n=1 Tax=Providencia TaxID=586 RepID=UPI000C7F2AD3|nr:MULTISPECIES: hypothetical protein [Providencia]AXH61712.1 hypothetical protein CYG50_06560 [Providencia huaxiensis]MDB9568251.1 hypothetical protein [Providencia rettgeri]
MKKLVLGLLLCSPVFGASAEWEYQSDTDQMRGTTSYLGTMVIKPISNSSAGDLTMIVASDNNKTSTGIGMYLLNEHFDCDNVRLCKIAVKFNKGKVLDNYIRLSKDHSIAHFVDGMELIETLRMVDSVFIEVPVSGKGLVQYKFNPAGMKWSGIVEEGEYITSIGDVDFIKSVIEPSNDTYVNDRGHKCNLIKNFKFGTNNKFVGDASICFASQKPIYIEIDNIIAKRNDLIREINKARKDDEELNGDVRVWLNSDDSKYLSSVFMSKSKLKGYQIHMSYKPNANAFIE